MQQCVAQDALQRQLLSPGIHRSQMPSIRPQRTWQPATTQSDRAKRWMHTARHSIVESNTSDRQEQRSEQHRWGVRWERRCATGFLPEGDCGMCRLFVISLWCYRSWRAPDDVCSACNRQVCCSQSHTRPACWHSQVQKSGAATDLALKRADAGTAAACRPCGIMLQISRLIPVGCSGWQHDELLV